MKRALVLLADGCEELEAVSIVDVLRRGGAETAALSIAGRTEIAGAHGIRILADGLFDPAAAAGVEQGHFGLQGVAERTERLNGELTINSAPGSGTKALVSIVLHHKGDFSS